MPAFAHAAVLVASAALAGPADRLLEEHRAAADRPGVTAAVVVDGELRWSGASGYADLESERELSTSTPLYIGSLSKVFTALLALSLVEDETLGLDSRYEVGAAAGADLRQLLSHASGLPREGNFGYWFNARFPDGDALDTYLESFAPPDPLSGEYRYSNIGYAVIGRLAETTTGKPYAALLEERVLRPLKATATGTGNPPVSLAIGYTPPDKLLPNENRPFAGVGGAVGNRHTRNYHSARAMTPAFGIYSTADDMARLLMALTRAQASAPLASLQNRLFATQPSGWGLGIGISRIDGRRVASHGGWFAAQRSTLIVDPEAGFGVVVLTNSDDGNPGDLARALLRLARESASAEAADASRPDVIR